MDFIKKPKNLILMVIAIIILVSAFLFIKTFVYSDYSKSVYGDRLKGIENVPIKQTLKADIVNTLKSSSYVKTASIDIRGKIINVIVDVKGTTTFDNIKTTLEGLLSKFSGDQKQFYDIEFLVSQNEKTDSTEFPIIGYKNKNTETIKWN